MYAALRNRRSEFKSNVGFYSITRGTQIERKSDLSEDKSPSLAQFYIAVRIVRIRHKIVSPMKRHGSVKYNISTARKKAHFVYFYAS